MQITLKPNSNREQLNIPYIAEIEIVEATVDFDTTFKVPVYTNQVADKPVYDVEICGFRVETDSVDYIPEMVENLLSGLVNMSRLPSYVFIARRSKGVYPVYTIGDEVFVTTPGGPVFRHVELAKIRDFLSDYLHEAGVLGASGKSDKLHVRGVNTITLALMRPIFYLKKRVPNETDFWAPAFRSRDGRHIYAYAASARREAYAGDTEVLALQDQVAKILIQDNRLKAPYDLRLDRLLPEVWTQMKNILTPLTSTSIGDVALTLYEVKGVFVGMEYRSDEDRYSLFFGQSEIDVVNRARQDLMRRGSGDIRS